MKVRVEICIKQATPMFLFIIYFDLPTNRTIDEVGMKKCENN